MNPTPDGDLAMLRPPRDAYAKLDPVTLARVLKERQGALARMTMATRMLGRNTMPLVQWFDWDRARMNVYHLVAPQLVKFT